MTWHHLLPAAVFLVTLIASLLSGMAGGGGGFIVNPFYILIGLTPQQTIATSKLGSFGLSTGAVIAFRERLLDSKKFSLFVMAIATVCGLLSAFFLRSIDNKLLQQLMGVLTLAMVPLVLLRDHNARASKSTLAGEIAGTILLTFILILQGILSGGIGSLVSAIFIVFFGLSALEANVMKRKASIILNVIIVLALLRSGLINYLYAFCGIAGGLVGGYIGSHIALVKGEGFAKYVLLIFMVVSGVWLLLSA